MKRKQFRFLQGLMKKIADSLAGAKVVFQDQMVRVYILSGFGAALLIGFFFNFTPGEWAIMIVLALKILSTEAMNAAVEYTCDKLTSGPLVDQEGNYHQERYSEEIKKAKDLGSFSVFIWNCVFGVALIFFAICQALDFPWWAHLF